MSGVRCVLVSGVFSSSPLPEIQNETSVSLPGTNNYVNDNRCTSLGLGFQNLPRLSFSQKREGSGLPKSEAR